jgi:hypothetical protein
MRSPTRTLRGEACNALGPSSDRVCREPQRRTPDPALGLSSARPETRDTSLEGLGGTAVMIESTVGCESPPGDGVVGQAARWAWRARSWKAAWYARAAVRSREGAGGSGSVISASPVRSRWSWVWVNNRACCRPVSVIW